jgi:hypothetical protein
MWISCCIEFDQQPTLTNLLTNVAVAEVCDATKAASVLLQLVPKKSNPGPVKFLHRIYKCPGIIYRYMGQNTMT